MMLLGSVGIAGGWLLFMTTTSPGSPLIFPVLAPIVLGTLSLFLGLDHLTHPTPDIAINERAVVISPHGRIPWTAIAGVHLITAHGSRYLAIDMAEPVPQLTERRWPSRIYSPLNKFTVGLPVAVSERWLRPISLDDIVAELQNQNPSLVVTRSER